EHFPQTSSVAMSSRAQTSGSRSKNEHGTKAVFGTLPLLIHRQGDVALDRFPVAKRGDKRSHPEIFRGRAPKTDQGRIFGDHAEILQLAGRVDLHSKFYHAGELRGHGVVRIMKPLELGAAADERLRAAQIAFFF